MKYRTQTLIFYAIAAILASFLITCKPFGAGDYDGSGGDRITYTDVEYSSDGKSVTIYLDGSTPVRQSRSLNMELAKLGHDFFEVAFYHPATNTIARAAWETGHAAGISGVARNVIYDSAFSYGASLSADNGAAIIFVGKKSDRTLLALGELGAVGGIGPINDPPVPLPPITPTTKTVTFSVVPLTAGTNPNRGDSSFLTAALQSGSSPFTNVIENNTDIVPVMIGRQLFPLYRFNRLAQVDQNIYAEYKFETYSTVQNPTSIDDYSNGILLAALPSFAIPPPPDPPDYHLDPRYPLGDGGWEKSSLLIKDNNTVISFRNNLLGRIGLPFENAVEFLFETKAAYDGRIFAFSFQVPVYPLTNIDNRQNGFKWYIRPGYDSYLYDLDDGKGNGKEGGTGGAILIGTGDIGQSLSYNLWVRPPYKTIYSDTSSGGTGYSFDLNGIIVNLRAGNDQVNYVVESLLSIPDDDDVPSGLKFYLGRVEGVGGTKIEKDDDIEQILIDHPEYIVNGMIDVTVEYFDPNTQQPGDPPYSTKFTVFHYTGGSIPDSSNIPEANRYVIGSILDMTNCRNDIATKGAGNYILVFYDSYDLGGIVMNNGKYFFIIIAAQPGVVIGRNNANFTFEVTGNAVDSVFYLGVWPFNDTLSVKGKAITSRPLRINASGSCLPPYPDTYGGYFIDNTVAIDVIEGPGLIIENEIRFRRQ